MAKPMTVADEISTKIRNEAQVPEGYEIIVICRPNSAEGISVAPSQPWTLGQMGCFLKTLGEDYLQQDLQQEGRGPGPAPERPATPPRGVTGA